jgi:hypothetical protein
MANFSGSTPVEINRFCGLVDQDDATNLPLGVAALARNVKYALTSVKVPRYGIKQAIQGIADAPITGLLGAIYTPEAAGEVFSQIPLFFDLAGNLQLESPVGTGKAVAITGTLVTLPANSHMIGAQGFNCAFLAFSDLQTPTAPMATYNLKTGVLNPYGLKPVGAGWLAKHTYVAGEVCTPSYVQDGTTYPMQTGHTYQCIQGGTSGAVQPQWPTQISETLPGPAASIINTVLDDAITVLANWANPLISGVRIYACDVATGSAAPATTQFKLVGSIYASGGTYIISGDSYSASLSTYVISGGAPPPTASTAGAVGTPGAGPTLTRVSNGGGFNTGRDVYVLITYLTQSVLQTVSDGQAPNNVIWKECTPQLTSILPGLLAAPTVVPVSTRLPGGGAFAAGRDVYVLSTYTNVNGETTVGPYSLMGNTLAGDAVQVAVSVPQGIAVTGVNIYECDVPTGAPAPVSTAYKLVGTYQDQNILAITTTANGVPPPAANTAQIQGNIASGQRYMCTAFVNDIGTVSGIVRNAIANVQTTVPNNETLPGAASVISNTLLDDAVMVSVSYSGALITGANIYEADVAHGAAAPLPSAFAFVGTVQCVTAADGTVTPGSVVITATNSGAAPPTVSTAGSVATPAGGPMVNRLAGAGAFPAGRDVYVLITYLTQSILSASNIPTGPSNTVKRYVGFTVANGTPSGPFFVIAQNQLSDNILMTSTILNDNTTTSGVFNFTDDYLIGSQGLDITDRLRVIEPNPCVDAYFSATTERVFQCGVPGYETGCVVSLSLDGESYYGDTSPLPIGAGDGQRTWCVREYKETIYALRERSGFVISPGSGDPATWDVVERWKSVGPCGPRAVDVCKSFMIFAHISGIYMYTDTEPECVTKEIPKFWNTINWQAAQTIWCAIDEEEKEVHFGFPVGGSTVPNVELVINFEEGWQNPLMFSRYSGKEITIEACRKFSVNDIQAFVAGRIQRAIPSVPVPNEGEVGTDQGPVRALVSQFLFGSSAADGGLHAIQPGTYNDNGAGIDGQYETTCAGKLMSSSQIHGFNMNARGEGPMQVSFLGGRQMANDWAESGKSNELKCRPVDLKPDMNTGISRNTAPKLNERWRLRITNGAQPDVWADVKYACIFINPIFSGRSVLEGE